MVFLIQENRSTADAETDEVQHLGFIHIHTSTSTRIRVRVNTSLRVFQQFLNCVISDHHPPEHVMARPLNFAEW